MFLIHVGFVVLMLATSLTILAISVATLWWQLYAWRSPENYERTFYKKSGLKPARSFSLIMPVREETEAVMRATIECLLAQNHPRFELIISCGHDDPQTIALAEQFAREFAAVRVSVDYSMPKNKPSQMNTALKVATYDIVGVFDAESLSAPDLLLRVDQAFQETAADVIQGAVQLVNYRDSWFTLRNCLEYRTWFRSRLHGHANAGFIPLGGNTVFIKRELLVEVGGWDGNCLAEDCDLGVRLSVLGKKVVVAYDPTLVTREETPSTIRAMIKQRTRWSLGFMQVLHKGDWKKLPTRKERFLAWWCLVQQHAMAFTGVAFTFSVVMAFVGGLPLWVSMISFLPAVPLALMVATEGVILHEFGRDFDYPVNFFDYAKMILSTPLYQLVLAAAAVRAMYKFVRKDFAWELTEHSGAHLEQAKVPVSV